MPRKRKPGVGSGQNAQCSFCKEPFITKSKNHRFCSEACKGKTNGKGKMWSSGAEFVPRRNCILCGNRFYAQPKLVKRGGGKYCSNRCRTKAIGMNPEKFGMRTAGHRSRHSKIGRREDLDGRFFRSSWEANYARYLNWMIDRGELLKWEYECDTFEFAKIKRGTRFYTPDFKVTWPDGSSEYHEIKGWMDPKSVTKLKRMKTYHPKVKIVLLDATFYRQLRRNMCGIIPNWE